MLPLALLSPTGLFFVHDFGWDVRASFVFDVDDARFLIALQVLFLRDHDSCLCKVQTLAKNAFVSESVITS